MKIINEIKLIFFLLILYLLPCLSSKGEEFQNKNFIDNIRKQTETDPLLKKILGEKKFSLEENPENKRIREINIVIGDIFSEFDLFPAFLNYFHVTTKRHIVENELLFCKSELFDWLKLIQTALNLENLFIFNKIDIIPVKIENSPGEVDILVITRDIFSIRLENSFSINGTSSDDIRYIKLYLTELNFLGLNKQLSLSAEMTQDTYSIGNYFSDQRIFNSKYSFGTSLNFFFRRKDFSFEAGKPVFDGLVYQTSLFKPSLSLEQKWNYGVDFAYDRSITRVFKGNQIEELDYKGKKYPKSYNNDIFLLNISDTRSFYEKDHFKNNLTFGVTDRIARYSILNEVKASITDNSVLSEYKKDLLPDSEIQRYIYLVFSSYNPVWVTERNLATYEKTEYIQKGYNVSAGADVSSRFWLSENDYIRLYSNYRHRLFLGENILSFSAGSSIRLQDDSFYNLSGNWKMVYRTPPFFSGNLFTKIAYSQMLKPINRSFQFSLGGGDNDLRGFLADYFKGRRILSHSVEFRSRPADFFTTLLGAVIFHDSGDAFDSFSSLNFNASAGIGLRLLIPQFNREVFRLDIAYPYLSKDKLGNSYLSLQYNHFFNI